MAVSTAGTTTRTMRRDARRNSELVLQAARAVVAEFGLDAGVEQIACRAGVGVGTVYRHFPNKEALIDELVKIVLAELATAGRDELARDDGSGLERFLRILGRSFAEHRGYVEKLVGPTRNDCGQALLQELISELLGQARQHGRIGQGVDLDDILATVWGLRGVIATTGPEHPDAWKRYLDIQLAGLRAAALPSARAELSPEQLSRIGSAETPAVSLDQASSRPAEPIPPAEPPATEPR